MRKIAVCDDESIIRQQLVLFLRNLEQEWGEPFDILTYASGENLLMHLPHDVEILLLDIKMSGMSGVATARKLRERNQDLCIIFITSMVQYALEGYDVHAFSFITKPLQYEVFRHQMMDALRMLQRQQGVPLVLKSGEKTFVYHSNDVLYFEVYGRIVNVVTRDSHREHLVTLKKIEEIVDGQGFFRVHKSYLVNMRHIHQINADSLVIANGQTIAISKHRRNEFLQAFSRYIRGQQ